MCAWAMLINRFPFLWGHQINILYSDTLYDATPYNATLYEKRFIVVNSVAMKAMFHTTVDPWHGYEVHPMRLKYVIKVHTSRNATLVAGSFAFAV